MIWFEILILRLSEVRNECPFYYLWLAAPQPQPQKTRSSTASLCFYSSNNATTVVAYYLPLQEVVVALLLQK